jgi:CheY-like chemotaxis protein
MNDGKPSIEDVLRELEEEKSGHQSALAEAERQRRLNQTLEEAVRARDAVLSVVAHDLRNPLNVISIAANTLLLNLPDASSRRSMERIVRSVQRSDRMIADLLAISTIETGRLVIEPEPVETAELILAALETQHSLAAAASVIVAADLSPDLPPLQADKERMMDVLENLIGNAIKFTSPGGSITVGASCKGDDVLVWVKDNGAGIPPQDLPHIFDRFWQAKKKERRGIGLGLSICKGIVEAHGGRIWADSTVGIGTTLFFTVPAAAASAAKAETGDVVNILLVDDRPENLISLKAVLERPEYRLFTARSGEEALALALRESFAVALIDIAMPGMTGLDVAVHLKELERSRDVSIIFVTAFGDDPEEIYRAYSAGGVDYLVKPLDAEIVRKKVAVFVDLSRRQRRNQRSRPSIWS